MTGGLKTWPYSRGMEGLVAAAQRLLAEQAEPEKAPAMAAYMKTTMPFYGVPGPARKAIGRELAQRFPATDEGGYREGVLALWGLPHREEKYLAIGYARAFRLMVKASELPLYRRLVVEGAWWDFVDDVAVHLVGHTVRTEPEVAWPVLDDWIDDPDMWLRRTAILSQNRSRQQTDAHRLFDYCLRRGHEKEFFIRKAIGWALRDYARTDPQAVRRFLDQHGAELSALSVREASKHLRV
jgi:3-methyladenine DNA glycosylase AlkD